MTFLVALIGTLVLTCIGTLEVLVVLCLFLAGLFVGAGS